MSSFPIYTIRPRALLYGCCFVLFLSWFLTVCHQFTIVEKPRMYTKYLSLDLSNAKSKENPFGMMMVLHALSSDVVGVYWFQYSKQKIQIYLGSHVFTFFQRSKNWWTLLSGATLSLSHDRFSIKGLLTLFKSTTSAKPIQLNNEMTLTLAYNDIMGRSWITLTSKGEWMC